MMEALIIRLSGPMMALGGPAVDNLRPVRAFPSTSLLTGLLANALGFDHREFDRTQSLQRRLQFACRVDRQGEEFVDYQTVDLGQDFMQKGWTTRGEPEGRGGGSAKTGTHIRSRHYWADRVVTVAVGLRSPQEAPTLAELEKALGCPARPLFLGRKCCLPSAPLLIGRTEGPSLRDIVRAVPVDERADAAASWPAQWPAEEGPEPSGRCRLVEVFDLRDWANQLHTGSRWVWEGLLTAGEHHNG